MKIPVVRVLIKDDVLFRQLGDEAVLLDLDSQRYFGLDEVGSRLWALLVDDDRLLRARDALLEDFDTDAATLDRDLEEFCAQLVDRGLIRLETDPSSESDSGSEAGPDAEPGPRSEAASES